MVTPLPCSALFERVFAVREDLVRSMAPPGIEGAEAIIRDRLRIRRVLELGIGAGPNIKHYAAQPWVRRSRWYQGSHIGSRG